MTPPPRLAVLRDVREEQWPSMDLCADMLLHHWPASGIEAVEACPPYRRRARRVPLLGRGGAALTADRLWNRFVTYPRHVRRTAGAFDAFHIVDHSYSQLVHALPDERTGVYCHDLDTFRCVLEPATEPRSRVFRAMARHILTGFRKAAVVFVNSRDTAARLAAWNLVPCDRIVLAPLGIAPEFTHVGPVSSPELPCLETVGASPFVLHVGSCIPRKRIDVLLDVFASVRKNRPEVRLVKVGGEWTAAHRERIARLGIGDAMVHAVDLTRGELAEVYRRAAMVLVPSEAEGFGLPVVEALACGAAVLASDLAVLREVGGGAVSYCPVADVPAWTETILRFLDDPTWAPSPDARLARAGLFSWSAHARIIHDTYRRLLAGEPIGGGA